jgi:hypothetical protein
MNLRPRLAYRMAQQVAELWLVVTRGVSVEAAQTSEQRRRGRGRRANRRVVNAVAKRQGLHVDSLNKALARLESLTGRNGHASTDVDDLLAKVGAAAREEAQRDGD